MSRIHMAVRRTPALLFVFGLCLSFEEARANGFRNPPDGAAALATDGGKIAFIDDASAVTHNPANLTEIEKPVGMGSLTFIYSGSDFDAAGGGSTSTRDPWKILPNWHGVMPVKDGEWALGLGVTTPFGQSTEWSKSGLFRYTAPYLAELSVLNFNPTLATEIGDRVSVGAGLDLFYSELDIRQLIPWSAVVMAPVPDGRAHLEGDGTGVGGNVGITLKVTEQQRLAVTYRLPVEVEYDGTTKVGAVPPPLSPVVAGRSGFDSEIDFPAVLAMGYGIAVNESLRVGVDVEWVEFSRFENLPLDLGVNSASGLFPPSVPQDWDDTWTAGVAADWQFSETWSLRGGYKFLESPIPDRTHAPTLPDADRHLITTGVGYTSGRHQADLAYAYSIFEDRDVSSSPMPAFNGEYDLFSHLIQVSYGLTF